MSGINSVILPEGLADSIATIIVSKCTYTWTIFESTLSFVSFSVWTLKGVFKSVYKSHRHLIKNKDSSLESLRMKTNLSIKVFSRQDPMLQNNRVPSLLTRATFNIKNHRFKFEQFQHILQGGPPRKHWKTYKLYKDT